jgi:hypothetical protein
METHHERLTTDLQGSRERKEEVRTACACSHGLLAAQGRSLSGWNADVAFGSSSMQQQHENCSADLHRM